MGREEPASGKLTQTTDFIDSIDSQVSMPLRQIVSNRSDRIRRAAIFRQDHYDPFVPLRIVHVKRVLLVERILAANAVG